jgi:tetratricopeptide (TPR) repeat protein
MAEIEHHGEGDIVKGDKVGVQVNQGPYSTYIEQQTIQYIDHKIQRLLTGAPFVPDVFEGRDGDYAQIHALLHQDSRPLLLLNGEGGIGKTSLAAYYWQRQLRNYQHFAWLYVQDSVENALLSLAHALHVHAVTGENAEALLARLLAALGNLAAPSLLVLDNVNDPTELQRRYPALAACANLHVLYTTRCEPLQHSKAHQVAPLDRATALQVFKRHYPGHRAEYDDLFYAVYDALGGNTLVLELLAKNLANINADKTFYPFTRLVQELQAAGLFALSQTAAVDWVQAGPVPVMAAVDPLEVLRALYDGTRMPQPLEEVERFLLSNLAVLPAENLAFTDLLRLLAISEEHEQAFSEDLKGLAQRGWIEGGRQGAARHYRISPVVQHIIRERQAERLWGDVAGMVRVLTDFLAYESSTSTLINLTMVEAVSVVRWAEAVVGNIVMPYQWFTVLCERIGSYHVALGFLSLGQVYFERTLRIDQALSEVELSNPEVKKSLGISHQMLDKIYIVLGQFDAALDQFQKFNRLFNELCSAFPENIDFKDGLAVSYSKLGDTYTLLGQIETALEYYMKRSRLVEELNMAIPENMDFKHSLAMSYGKLGEAFTVLGQFDSALINFKEDLRLTEELHISSPLHVGFKHGLAISYSKLGDTYSILGQLDNALLQYQNCYHLSNELQTALPEDAQFTYGLAASYSKLGETFAELGQHDLALHQSQECNLIIKGLHIAFPEQIAFKHHLAISFCKLGDVYSSLARTIEAAKNYQEYNRLCEEVNKEFPGQVDFGLSLAISFEKLGQIYTELGSFDIAFEHLKKGTRLFEELHSTYSRHVNFKSSLAAALGNIGIFVRNYQNDSAVAKAYFQQAERLWAALVHDAPAFVEYQRNLARVRSDLQALEDQPIIPN